MTVTWRDVARKDFEDVVRSKLLWAITGGFVGLLAFFLLVGYVSGNTDEASMSDLLAVMGQFVIFFIPLIALIAGYMAIVGERRSGSLRVLLSYPFSRADVVTGKVVGRSVVVAATILVGFLVVTALGVPLADEFSAVELAQVTGLTIGLGVTFTALAVGISAATSSRGTALAWAVGVFILLLVMWEAVAVGIYYLVAGARPGLEVEAWYFALYQANPLEAYRFAVDQVTGNYVWPMVQLGLEDVSFAEAGAADLRVESRVDGDLPVYLRPWTAALVFVGWIAVPLAIGYRRFDAADLE
ncbi:ABC-2 type transporter [Haloterrigena turkmenica DSM 5511]|uniref:ABC-2 type transporter n=1 Tax=Haloterrigena turkmenica (strain ATCC 51198 / DSM 5511 / JCM 9101 / NCIMB 13204 / VKM B-1734 / 4k) TaxID=543526 RepID=D2RRG9_HALTV|nr:ABC transporter permease [Haloterrigena turkmenica]ADB60529.1 ABC-2 type transporter [Haloterrigena turkmenica DSM 5511]